MDEDDRCPCVTVEAVGQMGAVDAQPVERAVEGTRGRSGRRHRGCRLLRLRLAASAPCDKEEDYPQSFEPGATRRIARKKLNAAGARSPPRGPVSLTLMSHCNPRTSSARTLTVPSSLASLPRTSTNGSPRTAAR